MTNILLTHKGIIAATDEIFVHTLAVETPATDLALIAGDAMTSFQTAWDAAALPFHQIFGSTADYTGVGAAEILNLVTGELTAAVTAPFVAPAPSGAGTTGALQTAIAVSLTAGTRPNGTPLRGRFYMPTLSTGAQTNGVLTAAQQTDLAAFVTAWFAELNSRGLAPSVWSRRFVPPIPGPALGVLQPLTAARVGRVVDTIRSRRNGLTEAPYVPITV